MSSGKTMMIDDAQVLQISPVTREPASVYKATGLISQFITDYEYCEYTDNGVVYTNVHLAKDIGDLEAGRSAYLFIFYIDNFTIFESEDDGIDMIECKINYPQVEIDY